MRTADSKFAKVQFKSFYCENKETGCIKMQYVYQDNGSNSFQKNAIGLAFFTFCFRAQISGFIKSDCSAGWH